jgi:hypothetical protein
MGQAATLRLLDLLGHTVEGLESRRVGKSGHRFVDALLRLSTLLLGDQEIPLTLRLLDLVVELAERGLELFGLVGLRLPRLLDRARPLGVLLLPHQSLLGEVVPPLLHGEHGTLLPLARLLDLLVELRA